MKRSLSLTDLCWYQYLMVLIWSHVNKNSVSIRVNHQYPLNISSHVCFLSSYFPRRPVKAHMFVLQSACPSQRVYGVCRALGCCCFKSTLCGQPLCQARVRPGASLSTGHRLHRARSWSACTGKWAPYALALSTHHRHPADRMQNRLCFLFKTLFSVSPSNPLVPSLLNPLLSPL